MLFNSLQFVVFFPITVIIFFLLPKRIKPVWLLISSYFFYMCWNPAYIVLILLTTLVTYASARFLDNTEKQAGRKAILAGCIVFNLSVLFLFKYFDFMLANINRITSLFGGGPLKSPFNFLLPVGISFYTFQAVGYVIDVYRHDVEAERNIIDYALFVSFFPQLVAGPIERSKNLLSQIKDIRKKNLFQYENVVSGFGLMLWGLFMKMVIADRAAIFVDTVFNNYYALGAVELAAGAVMFSIQIYADFAGYSSVAIGAARVMGIKLMENFETPYFATSISDFWRRWHISLSFWFRDYVYIPLGGNRKGKVRKYINLLVTFLVSGLWHGASWSFVAWGLLHGIYQVIGGVTAPLKEKLYDKMHMKKDVFSFSLLKRLVTAGFVCFAWIFFRAGSIKVAVTYIFRMFTHFNIWVMFTDELYENGFNRQELNILVASLIVLFFVSLVRYAKKLDVGAFLLSQNLWFRWACFLALIVAILVFGEYGVNFSSAKFIYFDF